MQIKEKSLNDALNATCLTELPKQYREGNGDIEFWMEAIALVKKQDYTQSYCLVERKANGKIMYKRDFGTMSPIMGLVSIHPYVYLDKNKYMPYKTIEQKRYALTQYIGGDEDAKKAVEELPDSEVEYQILQIAIETQYSGISIKKTHCDITNAVKGAHFSNKKENISKEWETKNGNEKEIQDLDEKKSKAGRPRKQTTKS